MSDQMSALFVALVICAVMPLLAPVWAMMLPLVLIVRLPLVAAAVCCATIPLPPAALILPAPPMNMLPVPDETAFTPVPRLVMTLPFNVIDVLPVPPEATCVSIPPLAAKIDALVMSIPPVPVLATMPC